MRVTACIVAFRNADDVVQCVHALGHSTHRALDIVICENGGDAAAAELKARLPQLLPGGGTVRLVSAADNPGYAGGFNRCLDECPDADAWWLVNPDAEPEAEALTLMLDRLARGDCSMVGGVLVNADGCVQALGGQFRIWLGRAISIGQGSDAAAVRDPAVIERRMNYVLGASMLMTRGYVDRVGRMRDDYFLYAEEVEWCLRGIAKGERLGFAPGARVRHNQGTTTGSAHGPAHRPWLPVYLDERNRLNVVRDVAPEALPVAMIAMLGQIMLRYARRGAWRQTGYAMSGWWAGVRNLRGKPARLQR